MRRAAVLWLCGLLATCGAVTIAHAGTLEAEDTPGTVLYDQTVPVLGSGFAVTVPLSVPSAGELFVALTDKDPKMPFSTLQFALANAQGPVDPYGNAGLMTLDLTAPSTVYVDAFGTTQSGYGLYNIDATFVGSSAVPLPGSAASLAGGLLVLLLMLCNSLSVTAEPAQVSVTSRMA